MNAETVGKMLINDEGLKLKPYACSAGKLTIGVGRNIQDKGISKKEAIFMMMEDIKACDIDLRMIFGDGFFESFPESVQHVLINMRFQLGFRGFRNFKKMIYAYQGKDYLEAARQMKDSKWYRQVPKRAERLIKIIKGNSYG